MGNEILSIMSSGADATIIGIGVLLMRMERRLTRLEFKVFGFDLGSNQRVK